jgi:predicted  nucleic acid-binding Zn-ribbon protein
LDDELFSSKTEYENLPARREGLAEQRQTSADRLAATEQALQDAQSSTRQAESALQDREALLEKLESQQFQIKSNNAYSALLREMEQAKESISEHETRILESMEAIESASSALAETKGEVESTRSALDEEERSIEARDTELTGTIERLGKLRDQLGPEIGPELLHLYERVAKRRRPSVALVAEERCGGCLLGIPAQSYIEILRCEKIVTCGNCNRILIHADSANLPAAS